MNNKHMDTKVGRVVSGMNWETGADIYIHIHTIDIMSQIDSWWEPDVRPRDLCWVFRDDLNGKEIQKRGGTRVCVAALLGCASRN